MSRNALRWGDESASPHRARNSCSGGRKTWATSSRGCISAGGRPPRSSRWASAAAHRTDCESPAAAAATRVGSGPWSGYRNAPAHLNGAQIGSGIQHVRGAGVAEQMRKDRTRNAGSLSRRAAHTSNRLCLEWLMRSLFRREQPIGWLVPAEVHPQPFQQHRRLSDVAGNAALALAYMQDHALAMDVADFQVAQFVRAQGGGVKCRHDGPVLQVAGVIQDAS